MGAAKRGGTSGRNQTSRMPSGPQTRASLPPKPASQKRGRNAHASSSMPPPAQSSSTSRAASQRVWSRRSASWTPQEDAKLVELVKKESAVPPSITASKTWSRVASQLTNRTGKQCRERYLNQLKPGIRRDPWSPEEERILREAHAKIGNKWVTIANQLPGRTDNCVKNHWNSMLRKRQRREAALRAAQAEVAATLGKSQGPRFGIDHPHEADHSVHTGCATPSGVSSSYQDMPTSGVPSPYTASSPITPKRDSKLQISTLVAASTKELPTWSVPYRRREDITSGLYTPRSIGVQNVKRETTMHGNRDIITDSFRPVAPSGQSFAPRSGAICLPMEATSSMIGVKGLSPSHSYLSKDVSPSAMPHITSAPAPRLPQLMPNIPSNGETRGAVLEPQVRRSSRLLSSTTKANRAGTPLLNESLVGIQKQCLNRVRSSDGAGGTALAALAAAASSVPPSPLTPESRLSITSRSRSLSPDPRTWHVQSHAIAGQNELTLRGKRRKTSVVPSGTLENNDGSGIMALSKVTNCGVKGKAGGKRP